MEIVVGFEEGGVGRCYHGFEERGGRDRGWLEVDVVDHCAEDADLGTVSVLHGEVCDGVL